jgi:superfamily II DNA or RNA helicase
MTGVAEEVQSLVSPHSAVPLPRPYQQEAIAAILNARARGRQRVLVTMPTGTGKTSVFTWLMERMNLTRPALVLAHRDELIRQAADRIQALAPGVRVGVEKAEESAPAASEVVVASVQSIGRKNCTRLEWLAEVGPELIICDEAHHAPADSYLRVFERFGAFDPDGAFLVGCTATPHRLDAKKMGEVFQEEAYRYEMRTAMQEGWLCPIRCYRVVTDTDISDVKTVSGDFEVGALSRAVNNRQRTEQVLNHWVDAAWGRRTIAFCVDVAHAHDTAALFRKAGIPAEAVDGGMPMEERRAVLARLKSGETKVVANCQVLTEGFDCPEVGCVVMLRPTKSSALYTQMAGRGTRPAPGKEDLILLDVVDNCCRHSLITAPVLLGLPPNLDLEGESLLKTAKLVDDLGAGAGVLDIGRSVTFTELETKLKEWDIFSQIELPEEMQEATVLAWAPVPSGFYLSCGSKREARIERDMVGAYRLLLISDGGIDRYRMLGTDLLSAIQRADSEVQREWPDPGASDDRRGPGCRRPATEKQLALLAKKGFPPHVLAKLTKGDAARAISRVLAR